MLPQSSSSVHFSNHFSPCFPHPLRTPHDPLLIPRYFSQTDTSRHRSRRKKLGLHLNSNWAVHVWDLSAVNNCCDFLWARSKRRWSALGLHKRSYHRTVDWIWLSLQAWCHHSVAHHSWSLCNRYWVVDWEFVSDTWWSSEASHCWHCYWGRLSRWGWCWFWILSQLERCSPVEVVDRWWRSERSWWGLGMRNEGKGHHIASFSAPVSGTNGSDRRKN